MMLVVQEDNASAIDLYSPLQRYLQSIEQQ